MTIRAYRPTHLIHDDLFEEALALVDRSGAVEVIEAAATAARGPGGRRPRRATYTVMALLVAIYIRVALGQVVTITGAHATMLRAFTPTQQRRLGLDPDEFALETATYYAGFYAWLRQILACLDSRPDEPARRVRVADRRHIAAERDAAAVAANAGALALADDVVSRIVAASILDPLPPAYRGDVVVDETTIVTSQRAPGQGVRDTDRSPASPAATVYARSRGVVDDSGASVGHKVSATGCGLGVTAIARVGPPGHLRAVTSLVTAIVIRGVTSGDPVAAGLALEAHRRHGFDPRTIGRAAPNARQPYVVADMGYNVKKTWSETVSRHGYAPVVRYPETWTRRRVSQRPGGPLPEHPGGPGPIMIEGGWYCPAAVALPQEPLAIRYESLRATGGFAEHDLRIRARHDLLMGTNGRARPAGRPGRPRRDGTEPTRLAMPLVCPADQGRLRCPLRPESFRIDPGQASTIAPTWEASYFESCARTHVTITMTDDQARDLQPLPGGSWEHMMVFEAYRAYTEARFSDAKRRSTGGVSHLTEGPRREPLQKITIAMGFAVTNLGAQRQSPTSDADSITRRLRHLETELGHPPARIPPRT